MEAEIYETLKKAGIDIDGALERFMQKEELVQRFLWKFEDDPNYKLLCEALQEENCEKAFTASHTLKGVCANLSLTELYVPVAIQTEFFRKGDLEGGAKMMPEIKGLYEEALRAILLWKKESEIK